MVQRISRPVKDSKCLSRFQEILKRLERKSEIKIPPITDFSGPYLL